MAGRLRKLIEQLITRALEAMEAETVKPADLIRLLQLYLELQQSKKSPQPKERTIGWVEPEAEQ